MPPVSVNSPAPALSIPIVILDTNALLDWRVFKDPAARPVAQGLAAGTLRWLACPSMEKEWHQVWPRSVFKRWLPDPALTTTVYQLAEMVGEPPRCALRCKDPDDQVFIDLAMHVGATWLFSKDAALLKLARRAKRSGVQVLSLQSWGGLAPSEAPSNAPTAPLTQPL